MIMREEIVVGDAVCGLSVADKEKKGVVISVSGDAIVFDNIITGSEYNAHPSLLGRYTATRDMPFDDWTVSDYEVHPDMSEETTCFSAFLNYKGENCVFMRNSGQGGETSFQYLSDGARDVFGKALKEFYAIIDPEKILDYNEEMLVDDFFSWLFFARPIDVTPKEFVDNLVAEYPDLYVKSL